MEDKQLEDALAETIEKSFNDSELEDIMNEIENLEKEFSDDSIETETQLSLDKAKDNDLQKVIDAEVESISSAFDEISTPEAVLTESSENVSESESEDEFSDEDFAMMDDSDDDEVVAEAESETQDDVMDTIMAEVEATDEIEEPVSETNEDPFLGEDMADIEAHMEEATSNVVSLSSAPSKTSSTKTSSGVDFNASGDMDLSINFNIAGQTAHLRVEDGGLKVFLKGVELTIDETNGCSVKMAGGVQFSVPLTDSKATKKTA